MANKTGKRTLLCSIVHSFILPLLFPSFVSNTARSSFAQSFRHSFISSPLTLFFQYSYSIISKAAPSIASSVCGRLHYNLMVHAYGVRKINFASPFSFPLKLPLTEFWTILPSNSPTLYTSFVLSKQKAWIDC